MVDLNRPPDNQPLCPGQASTNLCPETLFDGQLEATTGGRQYDVTSDGQRFILNRPLQTEEQPIIVTIGLPEDLLAGRRP